MAVEWKDPLNNNAHIILKVGIKQGAQSLLLHWDVVNLLLFQPSLLLFLSFLHWKKCVQDVAGITGLHLFIPAGEDGNVAPTGSLKEAL